MREPWPVHVGDIDRVIWQPDPFRSLPAPVGDTRTRVVPKPAFAPRTGTARPDAGCRETRVVVRSRPHPEPRARVDDSLGQGRLPPGRKGIV